MNEHRREYLRRIPKELAKEDVDEMFKRYNFFDKEWNPSGSFRNYLIDNGDGTITDKVTGLMWQQRGSEERMEFPFVSLYLDEINRERISGYSDWRLPTLEEGISLLEESRDEETRQYVSPLFDNKVEWFWTADVYIDSKFDRFLQRIMKSPRYWKVDLVEGYTRRWGAISSDTTPLTVLACRTC